MQIARVIGDVVTTVKDANLSGIKLLGVPYANQIVVASLIAGLGALAVWGLVHNVSTRNQLQRGKATAGRRELLPEHEQPEG